MSREQDQFDAECSDNVLAQLDNAWVELKRVPIEDLDNIEYICFNRLVDSLDNMIEVRERTIKANLAENEQ